MGFTQGSAIYPPRELSCLVCPKVIDHVDEGLQGYGLMSLVCAIHLNHSGLCSVWLRHFLQLAGYGVLPIYTRGSSKAQARSSPAPKAWLATFLEPPVGG